MPHVDTLRRQGYKAAGRCYECGGDRGDATGINCERCRLRQNIKSKKVRARRRLAGVCQGCGQPKVRDCAKCLACQLADNVLKKRFRAEGLCGCGNIRTLGLVCNDCWYAKRATGLNVTGRELKELLIAQNFYCAYSGELLELGSDATIDHKIPRSRGGSDGIDNLQWVHRRINNMKTDFTHEEFLAMCGTILKLWKKNQKQLPTESPLRLIKNCAA